MNVLRVPKKSSRLGWIGRDDDDATLQLRSGLVDDEAGVSDPSDDAVQAAEQAGGALDRVEGLLERCLLAELLERALPGRADLVAGHERDGRGRDVVDDFVDPVRRRAEASIDVGVGRDRDQGVRFDAQLVGGPGREQIGQRVADDRQVRADGVRGVERGLDEGLHVDVGKPDVVALGRGLGGFELRVGGEGLGAIGVDRRLDRGEVAQDGDVTAEHRERADILREDLGTWRDDRQLHAFIRLGGRRDAAL